MKTPLPLINTCVHKLMNEQRPRTKRMFDNKLRQRGKNEPGGQEESEEDGGQRANAQRNVTPKAPPFFFVVLFFNGLCEFTLPASFSKKIKSEVMC